MKPSNLWRKAVRAGAKSCTRIAVETWRPKRKHRYTDGDTPKDLNILSGNSRDSASARVPSGIMTAMME